jgi:hypothetical protein
LKWYIAFSFALGIRNSHASDGSGCSESYKESESAKGRILINIAQRGDLLLAEPDMCAERSTSGSPPSDLSQHDRVPQSLPCAQSHGLASETCESTRPVQALTVFLWCLASFETQALNNHNLERGFAYRAFDFTDRIERRC